MDLIVVPLAVGVFTLICVGILYWLIMQRSPGTERMQEIASYIQIGANAFLKRELKTIAIFIVALDVILYLAMRKWQISLGFLVGSLFSILAILIGMNAATRANVRTTNAAKKSVSDALVLAFRGGGIMGLSIVGLNLIGLSLLYIAFGAGPNNPEAVSLLVGYGFGASLSALFAQVGGGIYTKAADIGADLVGKVEAGIPEDDPRNPAVIADQVGDNVGDCAGRGADLFESTVDNLIATMIIGIGFIPVYQWRAVLFPLMVWAVGAIATIIGLFVVRPWKNVSSINMVNIGFFTTGIISLIAFYLIAKYFMGDISLFYCLTLGLLTALAVSLIVQYYTGVNHKPVYEIAAASQSGAAINIMTGFSYGMESAVLPVIVIALVIAAAYLIFGGGLHGIYGVAAATLGIVEMAGIIMAADTFGPIVDNAGGIAEMAGLGDEVEERVDSLDAVGNITKAITKGYAMTTCVLTSVAMLFAYLSEAARHMGISLTDVDVLAKYLNISNPLLIIGLLIGATIPFLFSAFTIRAVGRTAFQMINEVRRQFREIPGLMEGKAKPDYAKCVDISTKNAIKEMFPPTLLGLVAPVIVGLVAGPWVLAAFLLTVKIVGALLATLMFNAGAAWDNAKKFIEAGNFGGKGTPVHAAAVTADTLGDPFKDTAGPSLHILIKLEDIVSITLLPIFLASPFL